MSNTLLIKNCCVCWKDSDTPDKLVSGATIDYKVSGQNAGGLVGKVAGHGLLSPSGAAVIKNSYADCYLTGNQDIGGLAGNVASGSVNLTDCYAAGFIVNPANPAKTAGLVNGNGITATNVYSVVRVQTITLKKLAKPATLLYGTFNGNNNVRCLFKANSVNASVFGGTEGAFESDGDKPETHAYNLRYGISSPKDNGLKLKGTYSYPGLKQDITGYGNILPHYGDWAELENAVPMGLAYYEQYSDGTYSMSGQYEDQSLAGNLKKDTDSLVVSKDGYALVLEGTGLPVLEYAINYGTSELDADGSSITARR